MYIIFLSFFLLATGMIANKMILAIFPLTLFVGLRMLVPGVILLIYNVYRSSPVRFKQLKDDFLLVLFCAACTTLIPTLCKAYAFKNLISSKAALLGSIDPFIAALYGYFFFHEKLTIQKAVGLIIGFIGVLILLLSTSRLEDTIGTIGIFSYPEVAMLISVALSRFGWTVVQKILRKEQYTPSQFNGLLMVTGGIPALITGLSIDSPCTITIENPLYLLGLFLYTVLIGNILGYNLYARALKQYSTTFVALSGFSIPIFVHILGHLVLGEPLLATFFIPMGIIFLGLLIFYQHELVSKKLLKK